MVVHVGSWRDSTISPLHPLGRGNFYNIVLVIIEHDQNEKLAREVAEMRLFLFFIIIIIFFLLLFRLVFRLVVVVDS